MKKTLRVIFCLILNVCLLSSNAIVNTESSDIQYENLNGLNFPELQSDENLFSKITVSDIDEYDIIENDEKLNELNFPELQSDEEFSGNIITFNYNE